MSSKLFFTILLIIAGAIVFGSVASPKQVTPATTSSIIETNKPVSTLSSQKKTMGSVEVEIKPITVESGKDVVFQVSFNTHSVELNYDYTKIATLTDERENTYKPTKWNGGASGHHLKGDLVFDALPQSPKELTLILEGIDDVSDTFVWEL